MYQIIFKILAVLTFANAAQATGIHSSALTYDCSGVVTISEIDRLSIAPGFSDRAGHFHPASGHVSYKVVIDSLGVGCEAMQAFLDIDLEEKDLETHQIFSTDNLEVLENLAKKALGQSHKIEIKQSFTYMEESGYLPFFPMLHQEKVNLSSPTVSLSGGHFKINTKKVYDIFLNEEDKIELSEMIFEYLETDKNGAILTSSLLNALFENHPNWELNFKDFMKKILALYDKYEVNFNSYKISDASFVISAFTGNINSLSGESPYSYYFDLPSILTNHPSLINSSTYQNNKPLCPNLTTKELEKTLDLVEENLIGSSFTGNIQQNWKLPLEVIAGNLWHWKGSGCLDKITSSQTQVQAKDLLKTYY